MKLLITTQVVDVHDPTLGFFHRWLQEFATHSEQVTVICLKEGEHHLPANVRILSLGKEHGTSKLTRLFRFYKYMFGSSYNAVFVHMNPEYVVIGGWWWRIRGKRIGLWYVHKSVTLTLRIAGKFVHHFFTASKESFRLRSKKVSIIGHGIDIDFFKGDAHDTHTGALLSVGRLMQSKRHDLVIEVAAQLGKELHIAGDGSLKDELQTLAYKRAAHVIFLGGIPQEKLREEYRTASCLIHTSKTGSLDKVVLEALSTGLPAVSTSEAFKGLLEPYGLYVSTPEVENIATVVQNMQQISIGTLISEVRKNHALSGCVSRIMAFYDK